MCVFVIFTINTVCLVVLTPHNIFSLPAFSVGLIGTYCESSKNLRMFKKQKVTPHNVT